MAVFEDLSGRSAGSATLRLRGLAVAVAAAVLAGCLTAYAQGAFDSPFELTLDAASVGDCLTPGSEVKFRGLSI